MGGLMRDRWNLMTGDQVQVSVRKVEPDKEGPFPAEPWLDADVVSLDQWGVRVQFENGGRITVPFSSRKWRFPPER